MQKASVIEVRKVPSPVEPVIYEPKYPVESNPLLTMIENEDKIDPSAPVPSFEDIVAPDQVATLPAPSTPNIHTHAHVMTPDHPDINTPTASTPLLRKLSTQQDVNPTPTPDLDIANSNLSAGASRLDQLMADIPAFSISPQTPPVSPPFMPVSPVAAVSTLLPAPTASVPAALQQAPSPPEWRLKFARQYQIPAEQLGERGKPKMTSACRLRELMDDDNAESTQPQAPSAAAVQNEDEDTRKRELIYKFEILRRSYPDQTATIPDFKMSHTLMEIQFSYDQWMRRLNIDSSLEQYKRILFVGFMVTEWLMINVLRIDGEGFVQYQMQHIHSYDRLLLELGEKHMDAGKKKWPVELRLLLIVGMNAGVFIAARTLFKGSSNTLLSTLMGIFAPAGLAPPPPPSSTSSSTATNPTLATPSQAQAQAQAQTQAQTQAHASAGTQADDRVETSSGARKMRPPDFNVPEL